MLLLEMLHHAALVIAVSFAALVAPVGDRIHTLFADQSDADFIALRSTNPGGDSESASRSPADILLRDADFQQAAILAAKEPSYDYAAPDPLETEELLRESLVNVFCQYSTDEYTRTTTGTGFFIHPKGVILTNAHVAQFLLLEKTAAAGGETKCIIRTGNPAEPRYDAELLYISPTWIFNNASLITEEHPRGTGERDYALLYVSASLTNSPLPDHFPALPLDVALLPRSTEGNTVVTGGYPARVLLRNGSDAALAPVVAQSTVESLYTFGSNYADLFAIASSPVGEEGASGGPIVAADTGKTIGLIVTRGDTAEGERSLRALTLSYLDRTMQEETGFSLANNMQGDLALRGDVFTRAIAPFLAGILTEALEGKKQE